MRSFDCWAFLNSFAAQTINYFKMNKISLTAIALIGTLSFFSCKKDDKVEPTATTPTKTTTTTTTTKPTASLYIFGKFDGKDLLIEQGKGYYSGMVGATSTANVPNKCLHEQGSAFMDPLMGGGKYGFNTTVGVYGPEVNGACIGDKIILSSILKTKKYSFASPKKETGAKISFDDLEGVTWSSHIGEQPSDASYEITALKDDPQKLAPKIATYKIKCKMFKESDKSVSKMLEITWIGRAMKY